MFGKKLFADGGPVEAVVPKVKLVAVPEKSWDKLNDSIQNYTIQIDHVGFDARKMIKMMKEFQKVLGKFVDGGGLVSKVIGITHHINGISSEPYYRLSVESATDGTPYDCVVFDQPGFVAVNGLLNQKGDKYEPVLRRIIAAWEALDRKSIPTVTNDGPVAKEKHASTASF